MKLQDLVEGFVKEDRQHECKVRLDRKEYVNWLKTVTGFANAIGGTLYVGVENRGFFLQGFTLEEADAEKMYFFQIVTNHIASRLNVETEFLPYAIDQETRYVLAFHVEPSTRKPVILQKDGFANIYVRRDGYTGPATSDEIIAMAKECSNVGYDELLTDFVYCEEDFSELREFYASRNEGKPLTEKTLRSCGFFDDKRRLTRGALLFRDDCPLKNTRIACTQFASLTRGDDIILTAETYQGNLLGGLKFLMKFVREHSNHGLIKKKDRNVPFDSYPERAVFEASINALAHRDYTLDGTEICLVLFKNRLSLTSPGSFQRTKELSPTFRLSSIASQRRNETVCRILIACRAMEAKGTGFEKIVEDYRDQDQRHQPFIYSKFNAFTIVLPDQTDPDGMELNQEMLDLKKAIVNESRFDREILSICFDAWLSAKEVAKKLRVSDSTYLRKILQGFLIVEENAQARYRTNCDQVELR